MDSRIIDSSTISHYDEAEDKLIIQRTQDVEPILLENKAKSDAFTGFKGEMHQIASIPLSIVEKWINEEGVNVLQQGNEEFLARKLMDPDYANLRTVPQIRL